MKFLVVDDNPDSLHACTELLRHMGHETLVASNADDALEIIKNQPPDAVISDIMMPGRSGLDFLADTLSIPGAPPVIMLTAYSNTDNAIKAIRNGAFDFLKKPAGLEELQACISRVKRNAGMKQDLEREREERVRAQARIESQRETQRILKERNEELERLNRQLQENQRQLVQSEKMAAIGQLAAGVAHEINNPVGYVKSNLGTLREYFEVLQQLLDLYAEMTGKPAEVQAPIEAKIRKIVEDEDLEFVMDDLANVLSESIDGTHRIQEIVQNLKSFARADDNEMHEFDLNEGIEATLNIVWNELKYKCEVKKEFGQLPMIRCYGGQLNQVWMNLLVNASHAIEDHGEIRVSTQCTDGEVIVRVSDTGKGIEPENLKRIFNPFFTTKEVGKGTGLGLSISHGIIESHGGRIEVDSEVGKGTCFSVYLPVEQQA